MEHRTRLHRCIAESRLWVGIFFGLNSPSVAELIVNGTELDSVAVELQHAQASSGDSTAILRAVQAADPEVTPLVRLPDHSVYWIQQSLDAGFTGMIAPLVESAEQTETSADGYFALSVYGVHCGRPDWTHRALGHVEQNFIDGDGSLRQKANRDQMMTYVPGWLAWAALRAEKFQLNRQLLDFIGGFQDPSSGGFFAGTDERENQRGAIDLDSTTISILALAQGGRTKAAARGGDYLLNLCGVQPEPERQFSTGWSESEGLQAQADHVSATTILRWDQPKQHYYKVGLIVEALVHVYGATGDSNYLDAAVTLYTDTITRATDLWANTLSHKMCWAATTLHAVTGETDYLNHACRFADYIVSLQQPDDAFTYPEIWPSYPPERWEALANIGPQFALWIRRTLQALEGVAVNG